MWSRRVVDVVTTSSRLLKTASQSLRWSSAWSLPLTVGGVRKDAPLEDFLAEYSRMFFDDSITKDDPTVCRLRDGILAGERAALASAITLVESTHPRKRSQGNVLLQEMLHEERRRFELKGRDSLIFRIAISGSPGVGKSSFIEALGHELTENRGRKVAVLTIDPSSQVTGGSVLGDLTRMQNLSRNPRAYIRQSPSCGALGGVTRGIHEAVILCEGAGFDVVIIETVGVGQSEVSVVDMCDMLCLLLSPAHGDELQGVKRGIMEMSDLLVVTKDDGDLKAKAKLAQAEHISALKFMRPRTPEWSPKVLRSSIMDGASVSAVWDAMEDYWKVIGESGTLLQRRDRQMEKCMWVHVEEQLMALFSRHPKLVSQTKEVERAVKKGEITPGQAADTLVRTFFGIKARLEGK